MNPFADLVNKVRLRFFVSESAPPTIARKSAPPVEKPTSERLGKTVMPHATRTIAPQDPFRVAAGNPMLPNAMIAGKTAPRIVSFGGTQSALRPHDFPPAIALALEPKIERAISLQLSEILDQVPFGYIKSEESFDPTRRILLKAIEVEKGMATRNPSVSLANIYEQIPEIFMRSVTLTDNTRIALPFEKVLEQFDRLNVRRDQVRDNAVPQVETPFLIVALEESEKFGTTIEPLQASAFPPVRVETATAEAHAAAEPEATETSAPVTLPRSEILPPESRVSEMPPHSFAPAPTRIPFHLPPKGTGAPASERVPASSGPPVLPPPILPRPAPPKKAQPTGPLRNPYESVPFDQLKFPSPEPGSTSEPAAKTAPRRKRKTSESIDFEPITAPLVEEPEKVDEKIALSLRTLLQNVPVFQRKGEPNLVPEDVRINLPLSLIAEQLATGRVIVTPKVFYEAIPADYQYLFEVDPHDTPVVLPLQEVMKNVPVTALEMRSDQEQIVKGEVFETPFSIQAEKDAKRFNAGEACDAESDLAPAAKIDAKPVEKIDAKQVVARAIKLPGVDGCSITFSDGLSLAGNLPAAIGADGLCAVAPTLLQRIDKHMLDTKLGPLNSMTLRGTNSTLTFFMLGNICLSALHSAGELVADTRGQLAQMVDELSRTYSQPEVSHVDH
jgi:predicted regulator of Ras-like GTPase activity (Roadblock/LC7/MglB family)